MKGLIFLMGMAAATVCFVLLLVPAFAHAAKAAFLPPGIGRFKQGKRGYRALSRYISQGAEQASQFARNFHATGNERLLRDETDEAIVYFRAALALDKRPKYAMSLAHALSERNEVEEASAWLSLAKELNGQQNRRSSDFERAFQQVAHELSSKCNTRGHKCDITIPAAVFDALAPSFNSIKIKPSSALFLGQLGVAVAEVAGDNGLLRCIAAKSYWDALVLRSAMEDKKWATLMGDHFEYTLGYGHILRAVSHLPDEEGSYVQTAARSILFEGCAIHGASSKMLLDYCASEMRRRTEDLQFHLDQSVAAEQTFVDVLKYLESAEIWLKRYTIGGGVPGPLQKLLGATAHWERWEEIKKSSEHLQRAWELLSDMAIYDHDCDSQQLLFNAKFGIGMLLYQTLFSLPDQGAAMGILRVLVQDLDTVKKKCPGKLKYLESPRSIKFVLQTSKREMQFVSQLAFSPRYTGKTERDITFAGDDGTSNVAV